MCLYLWQGWQPSDTETGEESTGSGAVRWQAERRAAMMTIISYARAKYQSTVQPPLKLVWAGHEPQDFINFFPEWSSNNIVARTNQEVTTVCIVRDEVRGSGSLMLLCSMPPTRGLWVPLWHMRVSVSNI